MGTSGSTFLERDATLGRLKALAGRFSREDLLRAFDLLTRAETDVRTAAQPRYHLEMALLRGPRPLCWNCADDPVTQCAKSPIRFPSPRQKRRAALR